MTPALLPPNEYELAHRDALDSAHDSANDDMDFDSRGQSFESYTGRPSIAQRLRDFVGFLTPHQRTIRHKYHQVRRGRDIAAPQLPTRTRPYPRLTGRGMRFYVQFLSISILALVVFTGLLNPSYTNPPPLYRRFREMASTSSEDGRGNPESQKVFIAASLYDPTGSLLEGPWADAMVRLIELLGKDNVFLSIYENGDDSDAENALADFGGRIRCQKDIRYDRSFKMKSIPHVKLPSGEERIKRIAYLAAIRNMALKPLEKKKVAKMDFGKVLIINDIMFDPVEILQLLFATNANEDGKSQYRAACAVDFINPFKFYDTYATRDHEGFSMGVPFFPWFTNSGEGLSRKDVRAGRDAVRVKSCWGGVVAFDAKPFLAKKPLRFRASDELYWDASECCLIHADLANSSEFDADDVGSPTGASSGIFLNPYVRVAYDPRTLRYLSFTRRFERLYSLPHWIVNHLVGLPWHNPRRLDEASVDGFCGRRGLQLMKTNIAPGEKPWENIPVPD